MGDLDETDGIRNNIDETSWQKGALFHVKMFVKYEIGAGSVSSGVRIKCKAISCLAPLTRKVSYTGALGSIFF